MEGASEKAERKQWVLIQCRDMTIETLEGLMEQKQRIENLKAEIEESYNTYHSPGFYSFGKQSGKRDPVQVAAFRAIQKKEELQKEIEAFYETLEGVEKWLLTLEDYETVSIIRWHYLLGMNWRETNKKVYGYSDWHRSRKRINRFFGRE